MDVHGQSQDPDTTFRGTRAGVTTRALLGRHGQAAIQGVSSIVGVLAAKGYAVNPPVDAQSLGEDPRYSGGFTVFQYDTPTNPFDMLDNSKVYWVENEKFVKISGANIQIAKDDFQRYVDEILNSHDGTVNSTSFENFIEDEDVTSSYVTLNSLQDLLLLSFWYSFHLLFKHLLH